MQNHSARKSAWIEIDLGQLARNFEIINRARPAGLKFISVLKDNAYGHGMIPVSQVAATAGCWGVALANPEEALKLRESGFALPILLLGERDPGELSVCVEHQFICCAGSPLIADLLDETARQHGKVSEVHLKIDTGMSRYGVRWTDAANLAAHIRGKSNLRLGGTMSHFAMSDELDKSFALQQLERFKLALESIAALGIPPGLRHICNSGGFLDLPEAHFDAVRLGILPLGVYPSKVCRRLPGLKPVLSLKGTLAATRTIGHGDTVGYGLRYIASSERRIGVIPMGCGDGYPRLRNEGRVLIGTKFAPIVGSVSMDAMMVDISDIPAAETGSEVVLIGCQGDEEISIEEVATLRKSVTYDTMTALRSRLPRIYRNS